MSKWYFLLLLALLMGFTDLSIAEEVTTSPEVPENYTKSGPIEQGGNGSLTTSNKYITGGEYGIKITGNADVTIVDSYIDGSKDGIQMYGNSQVTVINSTVQGKESSVYMEGNAGVSATGSTFNGDIKTTGITNDFDDNGNNTVNGSVQEVEIRKKEIPEGGNEKDDSDNDDEDDEKISLDSACCGEWYLEDRTFGGKTEIYLWLQANNPVSTLNGEVDYPVLIVAFKEDFMDKDKTHFEIMSYWPDIDFTGKSIQVLQKLDDKEEEKTYWERFRNLV